MSPVLIFMLAAGFAVWLIHGNSERKRLDADRARKVLLDRLALEVHIACAAYETWPWYDFTSFRCPKQLAEAMKRGNFREADQDMIVSRRLASPP